MAEENEGVAAEQDLDATVGKLVEGLSSSSRRRRQEVSHELAAYAKSDPDKVAGHIPELIDALYRPEAQTRWEILDALTALEPAYTEEVAPAFDGAEASLFDDDSFTVRLSSFLFLCAYGSASSERSDQAWPLLDEAIQCFHGDAEYHDMLVGLVGFARGDISRQTAKELAARVEFDSTNGTSYIKSFSSEIIAALRAHSA